MSVKRFKVLLRDVNLLTTFLDIVLLKHRVLDQVRIGDIV